MSTTDAAPTYPDPLYVRLRAMKGRSKRVPAADLTVGQVVRDERVNYRVQAAPYVDHTTGSLIVEVYSEDNQHDVLSLGKADRVAVIGSIT